MISLRSAVSRTSCASPSYNGVLAAVEAGRRTPDSELPRIEKRKRRAVEVEGLVDLMAAVVKIRAHENNVAVPLLASRKDLEALAAGERDKNPLLEGWRRTIVGDELVAVIEGRVSVRVADGRLSDSGRWRRETGNVTLSYWWILIVGVVLGLGTQAWVNSAFKKYSNMPLGTGQTGSQVARAMLDSQGLHEVAIERVGGTLSDHYDPRANVLRLSEAVHDGRSVSSAGVASHEAGHAVQHAKGFVFAAIRSKLVPVAQLGSQLAWPLLLAGFFFQFTGLINLGIIFFAGAVLFQVVTLPVEFDASRRAMTSLAGTPGITADEATGARKVLTAAAMTYVAAALVSVMQLLYLMSRR